MAALALAWPSLTWPVVYDDLHQIRALDGQLAAAFRGRSDPDGIETQGLRPLNLLFNHAPYALFGETLWPTGCSWPRCVPSTPRSWP